MGDPKKLKKKYSTPSHPWQKARIEAEIVLKKEYGLKNKKEIWIMDSLLKNFKKQVKKLYTMTGNQVEKEKEQLQIKLSSLGLIDSKAPLDAILGLETRSIMDRRLQTIVVKRNLAKSVSQARQFIVHRHITVNGKKITAPSYLVKVIEESNISFIPSSALSDPNHPERYEDPDIAKMKKEEKMKKEAKKKKEEEPQIAAFEEVHETEEDIVKDIKPKKGEVKKEAVVEPVVEEQKSETSDLQNKKVSKEQPKEKEGDKK